MVVVKDAPLAAGAFFLSLNAKSCPKNFQGSMFKCYDLNYNQCEFESRRTWLSLSFGKWQFYLLLPSVEIRNSFYT